MRSSCYGLLVKTRTVVSTSQKWYSTAVFSSGPCGVEGRLPVGRDYTRQDENNGASTGVAITDPFILYQNYVSNGLLQKDELQLRTMKEFQKLYHRLLEYSPPEELSIKISLLLRKIELKQAAALANEGSSSLGKLRAFQNLFKKDPEVEKKEIVRFITDEDELYNFASPHGLIINGEVGCGKSMLMDIFAASLPHKSKMRWHYNNFILWVFNEMHRIQNERLFTSTLPNGQRVSKYTMENEFVLFEIAQKMIKKNTVLMLDEFMLPDIAAANIIKILFTYYFKLGGVLVATSNKLPEELYSNEFHKKKFKSFVGILSARCISVDMRSTKDYRVAFASEASTDPYLVVKSNNPDNEKEWLKLIKTKALGYSEDSPEVTSDMSLESLGGKPSFITVYNRTTHIPMTFNDDTVCYLEYEYICQGLYSSSDYITLASRFNTIILDNVPIMTTKMKNEARRFISFLDALYEAKCQFFMRSEVEVDYLFFPDASDNLKPEIKKFLEDMNEGDENRLEVQDEEMFAKTAIAASNPYRPNVASYDQSNMESFNEFTKTLKSAVTGKGPIQVEPQTVDFKNLRAFTGDDEKFAFKRAVSRITEMVGSEGWRNTNRWVPIDKTMRPWEPREDSDSVLGFKSIEQSVQSAIDRANSKIDDLIEKNNSIRQLADTLLKESSSQELAFQEDVPFRILNSRIAPVFSSLSHFWAMGPWTHEQGKRMKDGISRSWIRSSIRSGKDE
ncbi:AFG1-like ATPase-domain-containing protein [Scheffersomyces xylosifermentans]|uniref:AFG1-like ATPase-domain-containing protein n=1 Tax=Scheffersomyces xylosifermentans TaxID=1304137 RepID=UPI00315DB6E7